jgi:hypothetical protein
MALMSWATHVIQWPVQRVAKPRGEANLIKTGLSSDCRLQLACMKLELLVTVGQHTTVNTFPELVHTAHHTTKIGGARRAYIKLGPKVNPVIGVKL